MEKNLDITKLRYTEQILLLPWPFVKSSCRCNPFKTMEGGIKIG